MVPKFRCWDERLGLTEVVSIDFFRKKIKINHWEYGDSNFFPLDEVVLMQSTGLKDKNGVEIFEGDVLKNTRNGKIRRVHWNPSCASFHLSKHGIEESKVEYWSLSNPQWSYEIIGNIYENPELLEQADES